MATILAFINAWLDNASGPVSLGSVYNPLHGCIDPVSFLDAVFMTQFVRFFLPTFKVDFFNNGLDFRGLLIDFFAWLIDSCHLSSNLIPCQN